MTGDTEMQRVEELARRLGDRTHLQREKAVEELREELARNQGTPLLPARFSDLIFAPASLASGRASSAL